MDDGTLKCWGDNTYGQLGTGNATQTPSRVPAFVAPWSFATSHPVALQFVAAGGNHTCVIDAGGKVWCWGSNQRGQLGLGSQIDYATPQPARTLTKPDGSVRLAKAIAAGENHTCALYDPDVVACWGDYNANIAASSPVPAVIPGLSARAIAARGNQTCAIDLANKVECWEMQLGPTAPTAVPGITVGSNAVLAVGHSHACAINQAGAIECWGSNSRGELGNGSKSAGLYTPSAVNTSAFGAAVIGLAAGDYHTCAILSGSVYSASGSVACWGYNDSGQTGDNGTSGYTLQPVQVLSSGVTQIALGAGHSCAVFIDGNVRRMKCWGSNGVGQLGDGSNSTFSVMPVTVSGLP